MLKIAVLGAAGRMGRAVLSCVFEADDLESGPALDDAEDDEQAARENLPPSLEDSERAQAMDAAEVLAA